MYIIFIDFFIIIIVIFIFKFVSNLNEFLCYIHYIFLMIMFLYVENTNILNFYMNTQNLTITHCNISIHYL